MYKFEATMYVTAYELARDGLSNTRIGPALGVTSQTFHKWVAQNPDLADALARGRKGRDPHDRFSFHEYVYDHLSPHLRELWEEINECESLESGYERIEALLKGHGVRARQHLFMYALTQSMFNVSASLKKLNIPRKHYDQWRLNDPEFAELMDELHWHKKNFFEQAFVGRVAAGDTAAVIHAVKTQLRDRGYNDKIEIEHSGTVRHEHSIDITDLALPVEVRRAVLDALRDHQHQLDTTQSQVLELSP